MRTKSFTVEVDGENKEFVVKSPSIEDRPA